MAATDEDVAQVQATMRALLEAVAEHFETRLRAVEQRINDRLDASLAQLRHEIRERRFH